MCKQTIGWAMFALLISSSIMDTFSYPNQPIPSEGGFYPQVPSQRIERKFAEKPNALKKVALDDLDDVQTNQISESSGGGFSWSNLLGMIMQMIFNPVAHQGPNKSDGIEDGPVPTSPWANLISVGLKIITAILGGGAATNDGIDKVDNGGSPMQFINLIVTLLDTLKTSFSHRSLAARNLGKKDSVSDAAVASIAMMKGYVRSLSTEDSKCMQKFMCQANNECSTDIGHSSLYCQLGSYAASFVLDRTTSSPTFDVLYEAARRGRSGDNCQQAYLECNEV